VDTEKKLTKSSPHAELMLGFRKPVEVGLEAGQTPLPPVPAYRVLSPVCVLLAPAAASIAAESPCPGQGHRHPGPGELKAVLITGSWHSGTQASGLAVDLKALRLGQTIIS
jgi:hypothetical protein